MTSLKTALCADAAGGASAGQPQNQEPDLLPRKPMARATRITLFEREIRERLSGAALDLLFARAELLSEGARSARGGRDAYFGSTMLTFDLEKLQGVLRDACDVGTARHLAELLEADASFPKRIRAIAESEAARLAGARPKAVTVQTIVRPQGCKVFVDVDVEGSFR